MYNCMKDDIDGRIESIEKVIVGSDLLYKVVLNSYNCFQSSGSQVGYCTSLEEIPDLISDITFSNGEEAEL